MEAAQVLAMETYEAPRSSFAYISPNEHTSLRTVGAKPPRPFLGSMDILAWPCTISTPCTIQRMCFCWFGARTTLCCCRSSCCENCAESEVSTFPKSGWIFWYANTVHEKGCRSKYRSAKPSSGKRTSAVPRTSHNLATDLFVKSAGAYSPH